MITHANLIKKFMRRKGSIKSLAEQYKMTVKAVEDVIRKAMNG